MILSENRFPLFGIMRYGARMLRLAAFSVHVLTASGALWGLLALIAAVRGDWTWMFWWLAVALVVDGIDGPLARRLKVDERLPQWSGDSLDFVVDFVTYVFVPAYAIATSGLLPELTAIPLGALIAVSGALYFGDRRMKMADNSFRGFPVLWNAAAFYLFLLEPPPWIAALGVILLLLLTFVPFPFIHPVRVTHWRRFTLALAALGSVLAVVALLYDLEPPTWVAAALLVIGLYFCAAGLMRRAAGDMHA
jgi:phosphatidylcholine synthase